MKNFRSIFILSLFLANVFTFNAKAQTSFGINFELAQPYFADRIIDINVVPGVEIPLNFANMGDADNIGMGVSGEIEHRVSPRATVYGKAGFIKWNVLDEGLLHSSVIAVPIVGGAKFYIVDGLYGMLEAGMHQVTSKAGVQFIIAINQKEKDNLLSIAPGIGYELDLGNSKLDLGLKYTFVNNQFNYLGITAGINLPTQR
ncbi:MAG: hypothetical protein R2798_02235 [Chitinophagales bacterium]|nr:hypothetical protein [Bacteroidota bacterium]